MRCPPKPHTHLQNTTLKVFSKRQGLLIEWVEGTSCGARLGLCDAALAAYEVHLHVRCWQRPAALSRL